MPTIKSVRASEVPRVDQRRAFDHRTAESAAWHDLLVSLDAAQWQRPTVCPEWNVADIAGHLCGQAEDALTPWSFPVRDRRALRRYPDVPLIDGHMLVQADEHRGTPPAELIADFDRLWKKANRTMLRLPALIRGFKVKVDSIPIPAFQRLSLGYIQDVLLPRDLWMHRDDVCQALGRTFDPGHYGAELVAQVLLDLEVGEVWTGPPTTVVLTGPAGGTWQLGKGEPAATAQIDSVSWMRTISGRDDHPVIKLLEGDPAGAECVETTRMPF
jgi:uncharacterized protein (TIGR03083 family)